MYRNLILCLTLAFAMLSCSKSSPVEIPTSPSNQEIMPGVIDEELEPYVDRFIEEANKRSVFPDKSKIDVLLVDEISYYGSSGYCGYGWYLFSGTGKMRVEIIDNDNCWHAWSDIQKENFMFHELGHAFLSRPHKSITFPNQSPKSVMCSNDDHHGCFNYYTYHDHEAIRNYYLDELFAPTTGIPSFVNRDEYVKTVFEEGDPFFTDWELLVYEQGEDNSGYSYTQDTIENSITLSTMGSSLDNSQGILIKRFRIQDFESCLSLKAFADIEAIDIEDGYFGVGFSLLGLNPNGTRYPIYTNNSRSQNLGENLDYLHEAYCIAEDTEIISLTFRLHSKSPASIKVKNINVDLYK